MLSEVQQFNWLLSSQPAPSEAHVTIPAGDVKGACPEEKSGAAMLASVRGCSSGFSRNSVRHRVQGAAGRDLAVSCGGQAAFPMIIDG